jgi:hypothetical protein
MESHNDTPTNARSLVVRLPHKTACLKCTDMLSRWCTPTTFYESNELYEGRATNLQSLDDAAKTTKDASIWTYSMSSLRKSSTGCCCCRFLVEAANAIPGVHCSGEDYIQIEPELIGSKHSTPYERAYELWSNSKYYYTEEKELASQYMRYYRPSVSIYQPSKTTKPVDTGENNVKVEPYTLRAFYFVLPAVHAESKAVEATEDAEAFSGRLLDTYVDFNLIREWFKLCTSTHVTPLSGGSDGKLASESDFESDSLTEFEERVTDPDVCQPKALSFLPNFRLVDVSRRCIVRVEQPIMYAALRVSNSHKPYPVTKLLTFM